MTDLIVIGILVLIVGCAVWYIVRQKKNGAKCIGCPYAKNCSGHCNDRANTQEHT